MELERATKSGRHFQPSLINGMHLACEKKELRYFSTALLILLCLFFQREHDFGTAVTAVVGHSRGGKEIPAEVLIFS
jgi:hypothetical protein